MATNERLAARVIKAVARAHWRTVRTAIRGMAAKERETKMQRPAKAELIEVREDVTEYLLDRVVSDPESKFAEGVRQTLGWVLGVRPRPDYRDDDSSYLSVSRG